MKLSAFHITGRMSLVLATVPSIRVLRIFKQYKTLSRSPFGPNQNEIFKVSCRGFKKTAITMFRREISAFCFSKITEETEEISPEKKSGIKHWPVLQSWDVPWDWKVIVYVMMPYLMSIIFTGILESTRLTGALQPYSQYMQDHLNSVDEQATRFFMDQLLKAGVKLSIIYVLVSPYLPFPDDIFSYRWNKPFDLQRGWVLWGGAGLIIASSTVFLVRAFVTGSSAGPMQNEAEPLVRLLPFIGASKVSTICLLGVLGILTPLCEETLYRGFLMASLTKWLPVPVSAVVSSAVFALAHQSPGKSLEIFIFGTVLGLVYAQTRNLLSPITMHACWNLGVIFLLTFLQSQGFEIQEYVL